MNIIQNFTDIITKKYFKIDGRASRSEFWLFYLVNIIVIFILNFLGAAIDFIYLGSIYSVAMLIPIVTTGIRRLHDAGFSGWWYLISLTGIGVIALIVLYCLDSQPGTNKYGPNPKGVEAGGYAQPMQPVNVQPGASAQPVNVQPAASAQPVNVQPAAPSQPVNVQPAAPSQPVWVPEVDDAYDDDKTVALFDDMAMAYDDDDEKTVAMIEEEAPSVVTLTSTSDGHVVRCIGDAFSVGKSLSSANYVLAENERISRRHATFYKRDGAYYVVDSSKNGTMVNGVPAVKGEYTLVRDGDRLSFANEDFIFRTEA